MRNAKPLILALSMAGLNAGCEDTSSTPVAVASHETEGSDSTTEISPADTSTSDITATDSDPAETTVPETVGDTVENHAPVCAITEPNEDAVLVGGELVQVRGTATDADQASETLATRWASDVDGERACAVNRGRGYASQRVFQSMNSPAGIGLATT